MSAHAWITAYLAGAGLAFLFQCFALLKMFGESEISGSAVEGDRRTMAYVELAFGAVASSVGFGLLWPISFGLVIAKFSRYLDNPSPQHMSIKGQEPEWDDPPDAEEQFARATAALRAAMLTLKEVHALVMVQSLMGLARMRMKTHCNDHGIPEHSGTALKQYLDAIVKAPESEVIDESESP